MFISEKEKLKKIKKEEKELHRIAIIEKHKPEKAVIVIISIF